MKRILLISLPLVVLVAAAGLFLRNYLALGSRIDYKPAPTPVAVTTGSSANVTPASGFRVERVVTGLTVPWDIAFTSDTRMLVTERTGSIRIVENGRLLPEPLKTFPEISTGSEEGLMGMTIDPRYASNKFVYVAYAYPKKSDDGPLTVRVIRFRDEGTTTSGDTTIIDGIPAAQNHAGTRIAFGPDGKLYITTGDATDRTIAQDPASLGGKILRINPDGTIPADNPRSGSAVYSTGHRNPQGLDWHPRHGVLVSTEHGPSLFDGPAGGDEVNLIQKGGNYGWPEVSHEENEPGFVAPLIVFTPAVAPASGMFYDGGMFPEYRGDYFFGMLRGQGIMRVVLGDGDPSKVVAYEPLPGIEYGRIREVEQGPDGAIYFSTSNRDGRGSARDGDDAIYRILR
jgi:glucose/arabinose dehydrogenase